MFSIIIVVCIVTISAAYVLSLPSGQKHIHTHHHKSRQIHSVIVEEYSIESSDKNRLKHVFEISTGKDGNTTYQCNRISSGISRSYGNKGHIPSSSSSSDKSSNIYNVIATLRRIASATLLPSGYPDKIPVEYGRYQRFNLIQDLCSYLRNIMTTTSVLYGLGVGRNDITAVQATLLWIYRDGVSLLGGLLFTSIASSNFNQNVKSYRLFADLINNVGITLEMIAPLYPNLFLLLICIASICKTLCGIAASATNAAITAHFGALNNNIPDIMAKSNAQHNMVSLLGLLVSVKFTTFANRTPTMKWTIYILLTIMHVLANNICMRILSLRSINTARYTLLIQRFISTVRTNKEIIEADAMTVLSPASIAGVEPILSLLLPMAKRNEKVILWSSIDEIRAALGDFFSVSLVESLKKYQNDPYFIITNSNATITSDGYGRSSKGSKDTKAFVCFKEDVSIDVQSLAFFEAATLLHRPTATQEEVRKVLYPQLQRLLRKCGWNLEQTSLRRSHATIVRAIV